MNRQIVLWRGAIAPFLQERGKASEIESIFEGDKRKQFSLADYA
ncbi:MAG: hypothetical protein V1787_03505 [Candidatus Micrarchaeota archaeon]